MYIQKSITFLLAVLYFLGAKAEDKDTLTVAFAQAPPFIFTSQDDVPQGLSHYLWHQVSSELGIEYKLKEMEFGPMLKALEEGEIDICINPLSIRENRIEKFKFSVPYFIGNSSIAIQELTKFEEAKTFIKSIFTLRFFEAALLLFIVILAFGALTWFFERKRNPLMFRKGFKGILDGIWWSAVTMTTVGYGDKTPKTFAGRFIAIIWMFTAIIVISSFTAGIASSLTIGQIQKEYSSLEDFKKKPVGTVKSSAAETFLRKQFFSNLTTTPDLMQGLKRLQDGEYEYFIYDAPIMRYRISHTPHLKNLDVLPYRFDSQLYAFGISKECDIDLNDVAIEILKVVESLPWNILKEEYSINQF